ncbi:hypothetical protein VTK56DRAFT_6602 [Thermocarpiscus australiensis]
MVSASSLLVAALAALVSAAPPCRPPTTPTLPKTGGSTELPAPAANLTLKKIAIGHGIQNYTCDNTTASSKATGAVAVLYDVTSLYPGQGRGRTSLSQPEWDGLPSAFLRTTPLPLNIAAGSKFGANLTDPFPSPPADLTLRGVVAAKFLGHHVFDIDGVPLFDLTAAAGLKASVNKLDGVDAPGAADKGVLGTGAVQWLRLGDSGKGLSVGLSEVYRVVTAGGNPQACAVAGAGGQSVPYAAYYWFYG